MSPNLLVFNCGSSSLTYKVYRADAGQELAITAAGKAHPVGTVTREAAYLSHWLSPALCRNPPDCGTALKDVRSLPDHRAAAGAVLTHLRDHGLVLDAIGHRFVHGGARFQAPVVVTADILPELEACNRLAPIHNQNSLSVIQLCRAELPGVM